MAKKLGFVPTQFANIPTAHWETRDIALWAAESVIEHERVCAKRWGVLVRLMWACLGGIGLILIAVISNYISYLFTVVSAAKALHG